LPQLGPFRQGLVFGHLRPRAVKSRYLSNLNNDSWLRVFEPTNGTPWLVHNELPFLHQAVTVVLQCKSLSHRELKFDRCALLCNTIIDGRIPDYCSDWFAGDTGKQVIWQIGARRNSVHFDQGMPIGDCGIGSPYTQNEFTSRGAQIQRRQVTTTST
jgi:hypothetical protein